MENEEAVAPLRQDNRLRSLLQKHNRLLTFVGALIIFFTFVVKEGLRDQLKDLVGSTDMAENMYSIGTRIDRVAIRVGDNELLRKIYDKVQEHSGDRISFDEELAIYRSEEFNAAGRVLRIHEDDLGDVNEVLDNIDRLLRKVPPDSGEVVEGRGALIGLRDEFEKKLSELSGAVKMWGAYETSAPHKVGRIDLGNRGKVYVLDQKVGEVHRELARLHSRLWNVVDKLSGSAVNQAREVGEKEALNYRFYTRLSYVLYSLGWALGLIGRVFSVKGLSGAE